MYCLSTIKGIYLISCWSVAASRESIEAISACGYGFIMPLPMTERRFDGIFTLVDRFSRLVRFIPCKL